MVAPSPRNGAGVAQGRYKRNIFERASPAAQSSRIEFVVVAGLEDDSIFTRTKIISSALVQPVRLEALPLLFSKIAKLSGKLS